VTLELAHRNPKGLGDGLEHGAEHAFIGALNLLLGLHRHPKMLLGAGAFASGFAVPAALTGPTLAALAASPLVWAAVHRDSFERHCIGGVRSATRRTRYGATWAAGMAACDLVKLDKYPTIRKVEPLSWADRILVKLPKGIAAEDVQRRVPQLADTFNAQAVRVRRGKPGTAWIELSNGSGLAQAIPPGALPDMLALDAIHLGLQENGRPWTLQLRHPVEGSRHVAIFGMTGSGKSGLLWMLLRQLAPGLADGTVKIAAIDCKLGLELGEAQPISEWFAHDEHGPMADLLEQLAKDARERGQRMRALGLKQHVPTVDEPLVVVVIDEVLQLIGPGAEKDVRDRATAALRILLQQGRALGYSVIATTLNPEKNTFGPLRDDFYAVIGLRLKNRHHVTMVYGEGARDDGALCDKLELAGTAFVEIDGVQGYMLVRSAHVTQADRDELIERCGTEEVPDDAGVG
jgi:hypothetical protein